MNKFFPASTRYTKAREFLELKQGNMIVLEYFAKFTELARFGDDYVAIDIAKVRNFEDGLKLSIWGKISRFLIQDMDSMVTMVMAIERERERERDIEEAWSIRDTGTSCKRKEDQPSSSSRKKLKASNSRGFKDRAATIKAKAILRLLANQGR